MDGCPLDRHGQGVWGMVVGWWPGVNCEVGRRSRGLRLAGTTSCDGARLPAPMGKARPLHSECMHVGRLGRARSLIHCQHRRLLLRLRPRLDPRQPPFCTDQILEPRAACARILGSLSCSSLPLPGSTPRDGCLHFRLLSARCTPRGVRSPWTVDRGPWPHSVMGFCCSAHACFSSSRRTHIKQHSPPCNLLSSRVLDSSRWAAHVVTFRPAPSRVWGPHRSPGYHRLRPPRDACASVVPDFAGRLLPAHSQPTPRPVPDWCEAAMTPSSTCQPTESQKSANTRLT